MMGVGEGESAFGTDVEGEELGRADHMRCLQYGLCMVVRSRESAACKLALRPDEYALSHRDSAVG
jgi:hypothetical protein